MNPGDLPTTAGNALDAQHPWPGLWSYVEEDERWFHGRERERAELLALVQHEPLCVLFGVSGLGKTSLLRAGLFPELRRRDALPVPIRLDLANPVPLATQALAAFSEATSLHAPSAPTPQPNDTLWEFFHRRAPDAVDFELWSPENRRLTPVLVFDQFEEIFIHATDSAARGRVREFIVQLNALVQNVTPPAIRALLETDLVTRGRFSLEPAAVRVLLSLREDFVADLEGLRTHLRAVATCRLRLLPLSGVQALEVVRKGGRQILAGDVAKEIVRSVAAQQRSPAEATVADGEFGELAIDPALLSVMLRELNHLRLAAGAPQLTAELVQTAAHDILNQFYDRSFDTLPKAARTFVEDYLITATGWRDSCALDDALKAGLEVPALDTLVNRRLLRYEDRLGQRRIELAHDVLAPLVAAKRDAREKRESAARELAAREYLAAKWRKRLALVVGVLVIIVGVLVTIIILAGMALREKEQAKKQRDAADALIEQDLSLVVTRLDESDEPDARLVQAVRAVREYQARLSRSDSSPAFVKQTILAHILEGRLAALDPEIGSQMLAARSYSNAISRLSDGVFGPHSSEEFLGRYRIIAQAELGEVLGRLGRFEEARVVLTDAWQTAVEAPRYNLDIQWTQLSRVTIEQRLGDFGYASNNIISRLEWYQRALNTASNLAISNPKEVEVQVQHAVTSYLVGERIAEFDTNRALQYLSFAVSHIAELDRANPENETIMLQANRLASGLGHIYRRSRDFGASKATERSIIKRIEASLFRRAFASTNGAVLPEPFSSLRNAYTDLSHDLLCAKEFEESLSESENGLRIDPNFLPLQLNRAHALTFLGRTNEAVTIYSNSLSLAVSNSVAAHWKRLLEEDLDGFESLRITNRLDPWLRLLGPQ